MDIDSFNWPFLRPIVHRYNRRAVWHDYHSRCIYMITITAVPGSLPFSRITGTPREPLVELTPIGEMVDEELRAMCARYGELRIQRRIVMPDHLHFVLDVTTATHYHLGTPMGSLKGSCTHRYKEMTGHDMLFKAGFHDRILTAKGQLETMHRYVADNPRRLITKRCHPDLFTRRNSIVIDGVECEAIGNIFLLRNPVIAQVKVSRRYSHEQLAAYDAGLIRTIEEGGVLVSPFISPAEKVYRDLAINNDGKLIIILENGFGDRYKPSGQYFDLCVAGRLLLIAHKHHQVFNEAITYNKAQGLNDMAAKIASGCFEASVKQLERDNCYN